MGHLVACGVEDGGEEMVARWEGARAEKAKAEEAGVVEVVLSEG